MADSILAAVVLILNVLLGLGPVLTANTPIASWLPITITAIALCTAALCVRRTYPVVAWAAVVLIPTAHDIAIYHIYHFDPQTFTIIVNSLPAYNVIAIPMCLTALAMRHRPSRVWAAALASGVPRSITGVWLEDIALSRVWLLYLLICLICVIGALIGMILRIQEVQLQEMRMRSARLALAREQEALLSAANERSRIAREMHDVVAHSLAVMITMPTGRRRHRPQPDDGQGCARHARRDRTLRPGRYAPSRRRAARWPRDVFGTSSLVGSISPAGPVAPAGLASPLGARAQRRGTA